MTCGINKITTRIIFMLCIMQNFQCIILSAITSAATVTVARQCTSPNNYDSFIKFINESYTLIIRKNYNMYVTIRFHNSRIIRDQ